MRPLRLIVILVAFAVVLPAVPASARPKTRPTPFGATIRRTEYGIPHISARSYAGLGYGYGYALAQDNICVLAEDYVTVDAQRARYFGPNGSYVQRGNAQTTNNLHSDFFFRQIIDARTVERLVHKRPPNGPLPAVRQAVRGYVAGYDRYLADVGGARGVPDRTCRGKPWVRPIGEKEAYRRFYQLVELASGDVAIDGIGEAAPPTPSILPPGLLPGATAQRLAQRLPLRGAGSNAVAVGRAGTRDHRHGLLLGNPHFPWLGPERFYQAQLTIPGKFDVSGASLLGVPIVLIGHTASMAWSHTVSTAFRFTPYQLTLVPGAPTTYLYDGKPEKMTSRPVTVQDRQPDGSLKAVTRTLYSSRYGPIFDSLVGVPLPWTSTTAFALRDANANNFRVFNHFLLTNRAQSAGQELRILKRYQGIPWVNTIVADRTGHALYADIGAVPHVTNAQAAACDTALGTATFSLLGLPVLDGSRSACEWGRDRDAVEPGLFGPGHMPYLFRRDYVTNSNDSYWLSNPLRPLTGFARIIGDEGTARGLRTRIGLIMVGRRVTGADHRGPRGFTRRDMERLVFSNRQYAAELTRDALVGLCRSFAGGSAPTSSGAPVAVGPACEVLARWNLREDRSARGALLFRRFWDHADSGMAAAPFAHAFDPADPVNTPNTLDRSNPQVRTALGDAIRDLEGAGIGLDAPLGSQQRVVVHGRPIPIHGGEGDPNGEFNAIYAPWVDGQGLGPVEEGSSFVQVVTWNRGRCPDARTILTYSESSNPSSPHAGDQTRLFSRKGWVRDRFCAGDVRRATRSTTVLRRGARTRTRR